MLRNLVVAGSAALALCACDKPEDFLPKQSAAAGVSAPSSLDTLALRAALQPCERAMEAGSEEIAAIAVNKPSLAERPLILNVRQVCATAAQKVAGLRIWGRLKDPCVRAVTAREIVAVGALDVMDGKAGALGVEALRNKIADQAAASRACAGEILIAEAEDAPPVAAAN